MRDVIYSSFKTHLNQIANGLLLQPVRYSSCTFRANFFDTSTVIKMLQISTFKELRLLSVSPIRAHLITITLFLTII